MGWKVIGKSQPAEPFAISWGNQPIFKPHTSCCNADLPGPLETQSKRVHYFQLPLPIMSHWERYKLGGLAGFLNAKCVITFFFK